MTALAVTHPTLVDVMNRTDPDGSLAAIAEILNETNEILDDWVMIEANQSTGHLSTVRTGIPAPTWRKLYGGVQPTKSTTAKVFDTCGVLEAYAEVDKRLADLNGNTNEFRLSEDRAHLEGMSQEAAQALFTADESVDPEKFTGLVPRFNSLSAPNADNIITGGGSGADNASIWLICWGPTTVHGIYPRGLPGGLQMQNKGQVTIEDVDGNGGRMEAYRTWYKWELGLTVRDWRYVVRICNIDRSDLTTDASAGANLPELMFQAAERLPSMTGRCVWYMDRTLRTYLRQQVANGIGQSTLTYDNVGGKRITMFDEIPIRRVDVLSADEALVS